MTTALAVTKTPLAPFNNPEFFDQFEIGRTLLSIKFLKLQEVREDSGSRDKTTTSLVEFGVMGIYDGRTENDEQILIRTMIGSVSAVPIADIRGAKTENPDELEGIVVDLAKAMLSVGDKPDLVMVVGAVNELRRAIDTHNILIPRVRMA